MTALLLLRCSDTDRNSVTTLLYTILYTADPSQPPSPDVNTYLPLAGTQHCQHSVIIVTETSLCQEVADIGSASSEVVRSSDGSPQLPSYLRLCQDLNRCQTTLGALPSPWLASWEEQPSSTQSSIQTRSNCRESRV